MAIDNVCKELERTMKYFSKTWDDVEWAHLKLQKEDMPEKEALLKPEFSKTDLEQFIADVENMGDYDYGFGQQELFGVVAFKSDSWLERREYDGKEWWHLATKPKYTDFIGEEN